MKKNLSSTPLRESEVFGYPHTEMMTSLADMHRTVAGLIGTQPFHYVDYPVHGNIGDLLIMHGTLAFFDRFRLKPRISAPAFSYNPDWVEKGDVVVFHGGGNFGDLYSAFGSQPLREQVVARYPENRIVVLPQTIHFTSPEERKRSARIFRQHPDVHLCVRDYASYDIAREFTDHVYLLPDMAHQLYPILPAHAPTTGTLLISRMDDEKRSGAESAPLEFTARTDWPLVVGERERNIDFFRRAMRSTYRVGLGWNANKLLTRSWAKYSGRLVDDAVRLFSRHGHIVTDRLHGHILACLMNRTSTVLDNSYGKNSAYVSAWTANSDLVVLRKG
jgi:pyruvyl transferase EpsO